VRARIDAVDRQFTDLSVTIALTQQWLIAARSNVTRADQRLDHARALLSEILKADRRARVLLSEIHEADRHEVSPLSSTADRQPAVRTAPPPETDLLRAVLEDAIDLLRKNAAQDSRRKRRLYRETTGWLRDRDDESPFSFKYICDILGLDPGYVSTAVLKRYGPPVATPLSRAKRARARGGAESYKASNWASH
jgi:hypothetical protein